MMFGMKKTPAAVALQRFARQLDAERIKYSVSDDNAVVRILYNGDNFKSLTFTFVFDHDGKSVGIRVFSIAQFTSAQLEDAYEFCNRMNDHYRWLRFYVDEDRELTAALDAVIPADSVGEICVELLHRSVSIVDSVCKELNS
jgi:hypothetical protein